MDLRSNDPNIYHLIKIVMAKLVKEPKFIPTSPREFSASDLEFSFLDILYQGDFDTHSNKKINFIRSTFRQAICIADVLDIDRSLFDTGSPIAPLRHRKSVSENTPSDKSGFLEFFKNQGTLASWTKMQPARMRRLRAPFSSHSSTHLSHILDDTRNSIATFILGAIDEYNRIVVEPFNDPLNMQPKFHLIEFLDFWSLIKIRESDNAVIFPNYSELIVTEYELFKGIVSLLMEWAALTISTLFVSGIAEDINDYSMKLLSSRSCLFTPSFIANNIRKNDTYDDSTSSDDIVLDTSWYNYKDIIKQSTNPASDYNKQLNSISKKGRASVTSTITTNLEDSFRWLLDSDNYINNLRIALLKGSELQNALGTVLGYMYSTFRIPIGGRDFPMKYAPLTGKKMDEVSGNVIPCIELSPSSIHLIINELKRKALSHATNRTISQAQSRTFYSYHLGTNTSVSGKLESPCIRSQYPLQFSNLKKISTKLNSIEIGLLNFTGDSLYNRHISPFNKLHGENRESFYHMTLGRANFLAKNKSELADVDANINVSHMFIIRESQNSFTNKGVMMTSNPYDQCILVTLHGRYKKNHLGVGKVHPITYYGFEHLERQIGYSSYFFPEKRTDINFWLTRIIDKRIFRDPNGAIEIDPNTGLYRIEAVSNKKVFEDLIFLCYGGTIPDNSIIEVLSLMIYIDPKPLSNIVSYSVITIEQAKDILVTLSYFAKIRQQANDRYTL